MMVFISNGKKNYMFRPIAAIIKLDDGRYRPKHVVFPLLINTIIYPYIYIGSGRNT